MKVALLAGGRGTRMADRFGDRPKGLVPIGGRPILEHIMGHYTAYGFNDFVVALGYQGRLIREHFAHRGDDAAGSRWHVELVDTGLETATGGRVGRLRPALGETRFMLTWSDGLSDVDLEALLAFHDGHGRLATVTAVHPPARFGYLELCGDLVRRFDEKPAVAPGWINGAFFVLEPGVFDYIVDDSSSWERDVMPRLADDDQLMAWRHETFWQCMDTPGEQAQLERLWRTGRAPWPA